MRKFLIPLFGLVLAGCSNDITTKTDLGEKYIVKESAVTVSTYSWDDRVDYLKYVIKSSKNRYDDCRSSLSDETCSKIWLSDLDKQEARLEGAINWSEKSKSLVKIKFRPIFVNLNNEKIAKDYETIYCINPNLSKNDQREIINVSSTSVPNKFSTLAFEITKSKVCEKYAKF